MEIKGVNNSQIQQIYNSANNENKTKLAKEHRSDVNFSDKLDLSEDAKKLTGDKVNVEKVNKIKKRIDAGFYNSDAVISKVADRILKEIG